MRFLTVLLAFSSAAAAQPQASEVLTHVRDVYTHLQAIHVTAVRTDEVLMPGNPGSVQSEYELAEKAQGKIRAWMRAGDREGLAVSDGATMWKALPKAKQWMKLDMADIGSDTEDAPGAPPPSDLQHQVAHQLLSRYATLAKILEDPEMVREESASLKGSKTPCWVLRGHWKNTKLRVVGG